MNFLKMIPDENSRIPLRSQHINPFFRELCTDCISPIKSISAFTCWIIYICVKYSNKLDKKELKVWDLEIVMAVKGLFNRILWIFWSYKPSLSFSIFNFNYHQTWKMLISVIFLLPSELVNSFEKKAISRNLGLLNACWKN
jgi:hypothetical protein